jgi:integrase
MSTDKAAPLLLSGVPLFVATKPGTDKLAVSNATLKTYADPVQRMLEFFGRDVEVEQITRAEYAAWHDWLATRGNKPQTVNNYRVRMRAIWNKLRALGIEVCDISDLTELEDEGQRYDRAVVEKHLTAALQLACARDSAMILYMVNAGFRRQTVPRLRMEDTLVWQGPDGRFRIASRIPKEKSSPGRVLFAKHETAVAVMHWLNIREYQDSPWLFYAMDSGDQLSVNTVNSVFRDLRQRANLPTWAHFHPHALRHRFAQGQLDNADAATVAGWMGISVDTLLKVYARRSEEELAYRRFGDTAVPAELFSDAGLW